MLIDKDLESADKHLQQKIGDFFRPSHGDWRPAVSPLPRHLIADNLRVEGMSKDGRREAFPDDFSAKSRN